MDFQCSSVGLIKTLHVHQGPEIRQMVWLFDAYASFAAYCFRFSAYLLLACSKAVPRPRIHANHKLQNAENVAVSRQIIDRASESSRNRAMVGVYPPLLTSCFSSLLRSQNPTLKKQTRFASDRGYILHKAAVHHHCRKPASDRGVVYPS